jgi:hypothetical protein
MDRAPAPTGWKLSIWGLIAIVVLLIALVLVGWRAAARHPSAALRRLNTPRSSASPAHALQPSLYRAL